MNEEKSKCYYPYIKNLKLWFKIFPKLKTTKVCDCGTMLTLDKPLYYKKPSNMDFTGCTVGITASKPCSCGRGYTEGIGINEKQRNWLKNYLFSTKQI